MIGLRCPIHKNYINRRQVAMINQLFGENKNKLFYGANGHSGIDFQTQGVFKWVYSNLTKVLRLGREKAETDDGIIPITASHDGYLSIGWNDDYREGIYMKVKGEGYETLYFHLSRLVRWKGDPEKAFDNEMGIDFVKRGTILGYGGNSGRYTTGAHMHFELRINGKIVDPMPYFIDEDILYQSYKGMATDSDFFYQGKKITRKEFDKISAQITLNS